MPLKKILTIILFLTLLSGCQKNQVYDGKIPDISYDFPVYSNLNKDKEIADNFYNLNDIPFQIPFMPNNGTINILVIPILFNNTTPTISRKEIFDAFFSVKNKKVKENSLKEFLYYSSFGTLNITGTVTDWCKLNDDYQDFNTRASLVDAALCSIDQEYDLSEFDTNQDYYFDAVYFIYSAPSIHDKDDYIYWSSASYLLHSRYYDNIKVGRYAFVGEDHILTRQLFTNQTSAKVIIHETGHLLGLSDYYDTDKEADPIGGLGYADIMDNDYLDFNPYSKALLGWISPIIVRENELISLPPSVLSGDCVIIAPNFQNSIFTEFYILDFYTPGLNNQSKLFTKSGIRLLHCNAYLKNNSYNSFSYLYNNGNTSYKQVRLIEADNKNDIENSLRASNSDLFRSNQTSIDYYTYNNLSSFRFTIINFTADSVKVSFEVNNLNN